MIVDTERLHYLLQQYANNDCTKGELLELLQAMEDAKNDEALQSSLFDTWKNITDADDLPVIDKEKIFANVMGAAPYRSLPARKFIWLRVAAAAVLIFTAGWGYLHFSGKSLQKAVAIRNDFRNDIAPGGNKAILTLADGSHIVLDSAHNGTITRQGNTKLVKLDSGQLVYHSGAGTEPSVALQYNTIATPRGGQYQVVLPDGTKVWLNAVSSLKFPTSFIGKERRVELVGEAYFEVAKNKSMPFKVHIITANGTGYGSGGDIEVLGTHFNVNAYDDEAEIKTTLLEGSVKVIAPAPDGTHVSKSEILKPGQQAQLDRKGRLHLIPDADTDGAVAWKNGYFQFEGAGIESVMRQLVRWYDVQVSYEGAIPERQFAGQMQRGVNLSEVLHILEESNVHFRIEGKKLVVTP